MAVVGADGCRGGWLAIRLEQSGTWQICVFQNIGELWKKRGDASLILLDVPIGLPDGQWPVRGCDKEARQILGQPRGSSVFPTPCRSAVHARSYEEACEANRREMGKSLSKQTWGIVPKIREVDVLLNANAEARLTVREIHPELSFCAFAGGQPMAFRKTTAPGYEERMKVLRGIDLRTDNVVEEALARFPHILVERHDILDALAAAFTAEAPAEQLFSIPAEPEWDGDLRMEMVYKLVSAEIR